MGKYRGKNDEHIPYREDKSLTGTARYASVNAHLGVEQSRRDDLESIGYMMIYFCRGQLPWQGIQADTKEEKYHKIMQSKRATSIESLCEGMPPVFLSYMNYCRALRFDDKPDYRYLRRLFKDLYRSQGFIKDGMFDWSQDRRQNAKDKEPTSGAQGEGELPFEQKEKASAVAEWELEAPDNGGGAPDKGKGDSKGETPGQQDGKLARGSSQTGGGPPTDVATGRSSNGDTTTNRDNQRVCDEQKSKPGKRSLLRSFFGCLSC